MRVYGDLDELDQKLEEFISWSSHFASLTWFFAVCKFGQCFLCTTESLGPETFGFGYMFEGDLLDSVSVHLALNFSSDEEEYKFFWDHLRIYTWARVRATFRNVKR